MTERAIAKEIVDAAFRMQTTLGPGLMDPFIKTVLAYELGRWGLHTLSQQPSMASKTITPSHQTAKRRGNTSSASPWNFKRHPWLCLDTLRELPLTLDGVEVGSALYRTMLSSRSEISPSCFRLCSAGKRNFTGWLSN